MRNPTEAWNPCQRRSVFALATSLVFLFVAPVASLAENAEVEAGKQVFERQNCEGCHQNGGNLLSPAHPIKGQKFLDKYKDDASLEKAIRKGFPSTGMPPAPKNVINEKDMKQLITYIRSLSAKPDKK